MSVDVEALLTSYLRGRSEVTALVGDRVYTDLPHNPVYPLVLVRRTGGGARYRNHLESAEVDIDCRGGTHRVAQTLASTCLTVLTAIRGRHPEGVVTKVTLGAMAYDPEADSLDPSGHARPRFLVSANVMAHP